MYLAHHELGSNVVIIIMAVSLHWVKSMWLSMMRNDFWIVVEEDLRHNACNLSTWGIGKIPIVFADRHNYFCLAWSAFTSFSQLVGSHWLT